MADTLRTGRSYSNFNYFDQFKDMEIDLTEYLIEASTPEYQLKFSNLQPVVVTVKNLFEQFQVIDTYKRDAATFIKYSVQDNERIENVSEKFYSSPDFWWILCIFNEIRNPFYDLPLSENQIIQLAKRLGDEERKYPEKVYYKLIFNKNEDRREINIPKPSLIGSVVWDFRKAMMKEGISS